MGDPLTWLTEDNNWTIHKTKTDVGIVEAMFQQRNNHFMFSVGHIDDEHIAVGFPRKLIARCFSVTSECIETLGGNITTDLQR